MTGSRLHTIAVLNISGYKLEVVPVIINRSVLVGMALCFFHVCVNTSGCEESIHIEITILFHYIHWLSTSLSVSFTLNTWMNG